jgi:hypothetical protein
MRISDARVVPDEFKNKWYYVCAREARICHADKYTIG